MALKRIAYIVTSLRSCGPTNQLYNLVKYLPKEEFSAVIITLFQEAGDSRYKEFLSMGVEIRTLGNTRRKPMIDGRQFIQTVREVRPHIVHTNGIRTDIWASRYLKEYCLITTVHSCLSDYYRWTYGKISGKAFTSLHCRAIAKMEFPVACSYAVSSNLYGCCGIKTCTIQNGIDTGYYSPVSKEEKYNLRKRLGLDTGKVLFVMSGNLSRLKDPVKAVDAFLKAGICDRSELIMLGDGELMNEMKKIGNAAVKTLGRVTNVQDYLRASDVFVSTSHTEGMPMAVLEGAAIGLPVLLSNIDAHAEIVREMNGAGDLFEVGNVQALSRYMRVYTEIDLHEKKINARKLVEQKFNAGVMGQGYVNLYEKAVELHKDIK